MLVSRRSGCAHLARTAAHRDGGTSAVLRPLGWFGSKSRPRPRTLPYQHQPVLSQRMYGRHVFVDVRRLGPSFVLEKQRLARQRGARFAAAAFVTGALDPFADRDSCCGAMRSATFPLLLVAGKQTPPKSAAEMAALAAACAKPPLYVPGSLGLHEECAEAIGTPIRLFLAGQP